MAHNISINAIKVETNLIVINNQLDINYILSYYENIKFITVEYIYKKTGRY